jgi:hypothetical protein
MQTNSRSWKNHPHNVTQSCKSSSLSEPKTLTKQTLTSATLFQSGGTKRVVVAHTHQCKFYYHCFDNSVVLFFISWFYIESDLKKSCHLVSLLSRDKTRRGSSYTPSYSGYSLCLQRQIGLWVICVSFNTPSRFLSFSFFSVVWIYFPSFFSINILILCVCL